MIGKAGEEGDGGARMRLLAHHLDGAEDDAVDVPAADARPRSTSSRTTTARSSERTLRKTPRFGSALPKGVRT